MKISTATAADMSKMVYHGQNVLNLMSEQLTTIFNCILLKLTNLTRDVIY